jgi:hypothetical protein
MGRFAQPDAGDRARVLSVRLTQEEFEQLTEQARHIGVGSSTLARTLIRRGLAGQSADLVFTTPSSPAVTLEDTAHPSLESRVKALEQWVAEQVSQRA